MSATGPNLPLVIQQAPDVSRLQEMTQRVGEAQQVAAGQEVARVKQQERSQVQQMNNPDAENRVRADEKNRQGGNPGKRSKKRGTPDGEPPEDDASRPPGSLVDVVV